MASEVKQDPAKFAGGQAGDLFLDMLIAPSIITLILLIIFFIFGFTSLLGGPFLFFKVPFFLILSAVFCISYFLGKIYRFIKSVTKNAVDSTIKVKSKTIE